MSMAELCSYLPMCPSTCDTCPGTAGSICQDDDSELAAAMASDEYPHNDWVQSCSQLPDAAAAWGMSMAELCPYLPMCPSTCDTCPGTAGSICQDDDSELAAAMASDEYPHNDWLQSCSHLPDAAAAWGMSMAELCSYLPMCPSTCDTCPG